MKQTNKLALFVLFILIVNTVLFRTYYPNLSYQEKQLLYDFNDTELVDGYLEELKYDNGEMYLFSYDPYYYVYSAKNNLNTDNPLVMLEKFVIDNFGESYLSYINIIVMVFVITLFFIFMLALTESNVCISLFASLFLLFDLLFFINSNRYYLDTNLFNHLFFLVIFMFMYQAYKTKKITDYIIYTLGIIGCYAIFQATWRGAFLCMIVALMSVILWAMVNSKIKTLLKITIASFLSLIITALIYFKWQLVSHYLFKSGNFEIIAEIAPFHFNAYYIFLFLITAIYAVYLLVKNRDNYTYSLFVVWLLFFIGASIYSTRFVYYAIIPATIILFLLIDNLTKNYEHETRHYWYGVIAFAIVCIFVSNMTNYNESYPYMEDSIIDMCDYINQNTDNSTQILSWWDYGSIYMAYCNRQVLYSNSPPQDSIFSDLLITTNETEALNIARYFSQYPIIILNSNDLKKIDSIDALSKYSLNNESMIYRFMFNPNSLEYFYVMQNYTGLVADYYVIGVK